MIQVPMMIPLLYGIFIKETPKWASWATIVVGLFVSWLVTNVFTAEVCAGLFGVESLTNREIIDMNIILSVAGHIFITGGFFWLTSFFYNEAKDDNKAERDLFFEDFETPVIADFDQDDVDRQQRTKLGNMVISMGIGLMLMALIPNPLWGRLMFVCCSAIISTIGVLLRRSAIVKTSDS
jgi:hypothetical protein